MCIAGSYVMHFKKKIKGKINVALLWIYIKQLNCVLGSNHLMEDIKGERSIGGSSSI